MPIVLTSPANGEVLKYNGTNWVNSSDAGITGSGSAGQVAYFTGATTQAGNNNLFWDATNNRLGILTNTPTTSFHINSGAATQGGAIFGKGSYNYATVSQLASSGDALFGAGVIASATAGQVAKSVGDVGHYIKMQISDGITFHTNITGTTGTSLSRSTNERARFFASTGNFGIGTGATDSGQRLQVVGTGYFSDSVGIGTSTLTGYSLHVGKTIGGSVGAFGFAGIWQDGVVQSSVVPYAVFGVINSARTQAASFTIPNYYHFFADQYGLGAGSVITNQYGYWVDSTLTGATNNFGFYGNIAAATGRWNLYMNGTANNYMAGSLGVGSTSLTGYNLVVGKNITGSTNAQSVRNVGVIQSDVSSKAYYYTAQSFTANANFALPDLYLYSAFGGTLSNITAGGSITNQYGYFVDASLNGATNDYGFYGNLAAATGVWNLYMNGTALNYMNGALLLGSTTNSGEKLQVTGTAKISGEFRVAATINSTQATFANTTGRGLAISTAVVGGTNEAAVVLNARSSVTSGTFIFQTDGTQRVQIDSTGLIINGGNALEFINSAANAVSAIRPTGGGTSVMSTNSNGLHIAVGTEAAGDLILASNNTERVRLSSNGWFSHTSATNPSSSVTDSYVQYSADVTAGNAAPHFRTENGAVIKLYQETTAVGNSIISLGGGMPVLDDTTFDGYTLRQIVKALRNQGILA
jgi:hypothetical protein